MARGTVVGEPIVSQAQTEEWDEGYERTFGERPQREPGRRSYVYRGGRLVERGGPDDTGFYDEADDARNHVVSDLYMVGAHALDGTDIGSRVKRRRYMQERDLVDMDDFKESWRNAEKVRESIRDGTHGAAERRQMIGKALYEESKKHRR